MVSGASCANILSLLTQCVCRICLLHMRCTDWALPQICIRRLLLPPVDSRPVAFPERRSSRTLPAHRALYATHPRTVHVWTPVSGSTVADCWCRSIAMPSSQDTRYDVVLDTPAHLVSPARVGRRHRSPQCTLAKHYGTRSACRWGLTHDRLQAPGSLQWFCRCVPFIPSGRAIVGKPPLRYLPRVGK